MRPAKKSRQRGLFKECKHLSWDKCELFDVANDPHEFRNRMEDPGCASVTKELVAIAQRMFGSRPS